MTLSNWLKKLERKKIISRKPHPIIPFILGFIFVVMGHYTSAQNMNVLSFLSYVAAIFTFMFAIVHWIIIINLGKNKR